jgi:hypothetical protein
MTSSNESAWRDDGDGDGFSNGDGRGDSPNERHERMSIAVVVGNPKTGSRTLRVAQAVADILVDRLIATDQLGDNTERFVVDLADVARELFDYPSQKIDDLLASVAASDLVIAASPTYKATYTGLLKVFFDRYGNNGLAGTVGVPVMTRSPRSYTCGHSWSNSARRPRPVASTSPSRSSTTSTASSVPGPMPPRRSWAAPSPPRDHLVPITSALHQGLTHRDATYPKWLRNVMAEPAPE